MTIGINPVDSLVTRLIQQGATERHSLARKGESSAHDRVNFSPESRQAGQNTSTSKVEAKLLQMYGPRKS